MTNPSTLVDQHINHTDFDLNKNTAAGSEELAASELRYRRLFETAKDGILLLDAETGMVVDVNPFLIDLLGFSRESFLGKRIWELGFFKDIVANLANFKELQEKQYIRYEDKPLETADGRQIDVEFVSNVYLVNHQKVIQCNIRDITARKREEEVRARLEMAVEQSAEVIIITDKNASILYVNPAFELSTGYSREEAFGKNPSILKSGKQDSEFYKQMWKALKRGEVWRGHFINKRKDGSLYEEDASISPVRNAGGEICNYVAAQRDTTHEHQLEHQLRQAQKMEAVGRLAGGVAHDFNNLLMGIMGYAELCLDEITNESPCREWLDEITHIAQRSAEITSQLLAFARKQAITPLVLDLNAVVTNMLQLLQRLIGENINLTWLPGTSIHLVKLDPSQIDQILINLCLNGRDAIHGVGTITVETSDITVTQEYCVEHLEAHPGNFVCLAVSDDGSGMDAETLMHIFEPFFTTKDTGKGTGLGLATVYGIVKQNNGYIYAYSELGKGSTFKIYLPWAILDTVVAPISPQVPVSKSQGETILMVEDEKSLRVTCGRFLNSFGYTVLSAEGPKEALELSAHHSGDIQLLLTDVVMPSMDGRQLAEHICHDRPGIKVLYMSGYTPDVIAQRGILEKNTFFIAKPFTRNDLSRKLREVLDAPHVPHAKTVVMKSPL